jgi:6-phospho-3-hexuloisomerase
VSLFSTALDELGSVLARVDESAVDEACTLLAGAKTIGAYGCGREALQIKGFAMRLFHLGMNVAVVGDMTMPPLRRGDVFLVTAGPGELLTVLALIQVAKNSGAATVLLTAEPGSSAAKLADFVLAIPAQTMASDQGAAQTSVLPMGSVSRQLLSRCILDRI